MYSGGIVSKLGISSSAVRKALESTGSWARIRKALVALTDGELAEAEALERLGKRRAKHLRIFRNLRYERAKRGGMLRLKVEAN
jgi:hypothetical protein